ncbi:MAG TPA: hypothetical protein DCG53_14895 [Syntrophus sp. (in: bacteria)]|jgi:hypothetical protein|nr:hypothetical protein [Syntrophus sp. (in: bacteria)]
MNVIFYSAPGVSQGEKLQRVIDILVPRNSVETFRTMPSLLKRLHQPLSEAVVFVFLISSRQELLELVGYQEWLHDRRLILVLPDDDMETISRGHALRPRFVTYAESDFIDISAVLGKMLGVAALQSPSSSSTKGPDIPWERSLI